MEKTLVCKTIRLTRTAILHLKMQTTGIELQTRNLSMDDIAFLTAIPSPKSHYVLDELQYELWGRSWCVFVHSLLLTLHHNHKGISAHALERDEERRVIFMNHIVEIALDLKMLNFGDEAAKDERTVDSRPMFENWNKVRFIYSLVPVEVYRFFLNDLSE
ncbi:uncharacterized protein F5891DRAFT_1035097 [Suillus fuscotomentosus]|uniref:Uncharacterized protein n=1 Tax=Suillus fuscotomentosus TaxID=1912939 RepID=A0AAD4E5U4_9AGAM|nr:uncharacterized protein F5891DRAFT_1035097 [Suillus fuscotomentosus]KAG1900280.1 hypothetical protein F5891DRAFT_1035097 [Suillus fuscotomentosus]